MSKKKNNHIHATIQSVASDSGASLAAILPSAVYVPHKKEKNARNKGACGGKQALGTGAKEKNARNKGGCGGKQALGSGIKEKNARNKGACGGKQALGAGVKEKNAANKGTCGGKQALGSGVKEKNAPNKGTCGGKQALGSEVKEKNAAPLKSRQGPEALMASASLEEEGGALRRHKKGKSAQKRMSEQGRTPGKKTHSEDALLAPQTLETAASPQALSDANETGERLEAQDALTPPTVVIPPEKFVFIPLGGATGVGMNFFLYGYQGKWLIVDCGIGFAGEDLPGIDLLLPNPSFLADKLKDIVGLVVTHAHEDHIGAIPYLWRELKCPIYATPFAVELIEAKLDEAGLLGRAEVHTVTQKTILSLDPFEVAFISVTHSLPEPNALAIRTKEGLVVHTGDWKIDRAPLIGDKMNLAVFEKMGQEGVLALVCDSTNVFAQKSDKTEEDVRETLIRLVGDFPGRQIAVTCFASNVARIESICQAAHQNGRDVCLIGRSLWRIDAAARATGYLKNIPPFLSEEEAILKPKGSVLYICTGSQGEAFSALSALASPSGRHDIFLEPEDVVIFSSRIIPGNEKAIAYLQKRLKAKGLKIITNREEMVHVSGHYGGGELEQMYSLLKPKIALPVHGEAMELMAHVELAQKWGVASAFALEDGEVITLDETPQILGEVPVGVLALDGKRLIRLDSSVLRKRRKMVDEGTLVATVVLTQAGDVYGEPQISSFGLMEPESPEMGALKKKIQKCLLSLPLKHRLRDDVIESSVRAKIKKFLLETFGKRSLIDVHLIRV